MRWNPASLCSWTRGMYLDWVVRVAVDDDTFDFVIVDKETGLVVDEGETNADNDADAIEYAKDVMASLKRNPDRWMRKEEAEPTEILRVVAEVEDGQLKATVRSIRFYLIEARKIGSDKYWLKVESSEGEAMEEFGRMCARIVRGEDPDGKKNPTGASGDEGSTPSGGAIDNADDNKGGGVDA